MLCVSDWSYHMGTAAGHCWFCGGHACFELTLGGSGQLMPHLCELKPSSHLWQLSLLWCEVWSQLILASPLEHLAALQAVRGPVPAHCLRPYHCRERDEGAPDNLLGGQILIVVLMRRTNKIDASCFHAKLIKNTDVNERMVRGGVMCPELSFLKMLELVHLLFYLFL